MEIKDLVFEKVKIKGIQINRSTSAYYRSFRTFCIKWPKDKRTRVTKVGVCRNPDWVANEKDYPDNERGRSWYWNLTTRELEDSKYGPPYNQYPQQVADFEVSETFWMFLDNDKGTLRFAMYGQKDLGVAFDDLDGNLLYITYVEEPSPEDEVKIDIEGPNPISPRMRKNCYFC